MMTSQLAGTWRLVAARALDRDGREIGLPYGPEPMGRLILTEGGRMLAVLCDGRSALEPDEPRAYASYGGSYEIIGNELVTTVDIALIPDRIGGQQRRRFEHRDGMLILFPPRRANGEQREISWRHDGPA